MLFKSLTALFTSDYLDRILGQFSEAVLLAFNSDRHRFIPDALRDLADLEVRPECLTAFAYEWCSAIYENRETLRDWRSLLFVCLKIGFRHFDARRYYEIRLTHTEQHWRLVDVVFESQENQTIADLLCAWTMGHQFPGPADTLVNICAGHLDGLHNLIHYSSRSRLLVIRFVENAGYKGFEGAGVENLIELLDHIHVAFKEMGQKSMWMALLLDVIRSPKGTQYLSHHCWELLLELAVLSPGWLSHEVANSAEITKSLVEAPEWGKLECWIGLAWILRVEEDLENPMVLLFRQRPGAAQKLKEWMERSCQLKGVNIPATFQRICTRAHEPVQGQVVR